jgi:hypothetical protein
MQINLKQELAFKKIMANIANFSTQYGSISNLIIMKNPNFPTSIFIKYEKQYGVVKDRTIEMNIVEINDRGDFIRLNDVLKSIYERYTFLGECLPIEANELIVM